jgi:mono/diheme cytochrome c family protein
MLKQMVCAVALVAATAAAAEDFSAGKLEYDAACAACHGAGGKGDGAFAELLTVKVPDITTLSARNEGKFPTLAVMQIIDGRTGVRGHGGPMPIWGDSFRASIGDQAGPYGAEQLVRARVLELVLYIQSLQE